MENKPNKQYTEEQWNKFLELDLPDKKEKNNIPFPEDLEENIRDIEFER